MELREYFSLLKRNWWIVVSLFLVTLVVGLTLSYREPPLFESQATFIISPSRSATTETGDLPYILGEISRSGASHTYCQVLTSDAIREEAARALNLALVVLEPYEVICNVLPDTNVLSLIVIGPSPNLTADLGRAIGDSGIAYVGTLYEVFEIKWLDLPLANPEPVSPDHMRNIVLTSVLGLILGIAVVLLKEYLQAPLSRVQGMSIIDAETGLYTERYLAQRLDQEINRSRQRLRPLSVALLYIDAVEELDRYPEVAQNRLQRKLTAFLSDRMRAVDLLAHVQDETYAIILPETPGDDAREVVNSLIDNLRSATFTLDDLGLSASFTAAAGIIESSGGSLDRKEMLSRAEDALEGALEEGMNTVHLIRSTPRPFLDEDVPYEPSAPEPGATVSGGVFWQDQG